MSASPADRTPGQTPNGTLPPLIRRPKPAADPLVRPKQKRAVRRPASGPSGVVNGVNGNFYPNGLAVSGQGMTQTIPKRLSKAPAAVPASQSQPQTIISDDLDCTTSGFSAPPVAPYTDYPLVLTKRQLTEGVRYHVAKFYSKKDIDPRNEADFTRPVRLHRRDARAPPGGGGGVKDENGAGGGDSKDTSVDEKERLKQELLQEQRIAEREAEMAQVAPAANTGKGKPGASKKKTQQVFRNDQTEEQKAKSKLRYEEALPWHLEDFDNKQTWVGTYEAALSETQAQLVRQDGKFYVTPVEKWYKFAPKAQFSTLTIEEAEKEMGKKVKDPKWFSEHVKAKNNKQEEDRNSKAGRKLYVGKVMKSDDNERLNKAVVNREGVDADELDFEEMFADDEENQLFEGDPEEAKEAEERIRNDQLQANVFDLKDEKQYEKADVLERKLKEAGKKLGKGVRKALMRREKNYVYDDDDSSNPYSSESESSDSETERLKEEQLKKETEEKKAAAAEKQKPQPPSGSSTKETNTPSSRPGKHPDPLNRTVSSSTLKRPGSPNLSEASGNESARKKHKKKHNLAKTATGISTPNGPPSRPRSPAPAPTSSAPDPVLAPSGSQPPARPQPQRKGSMIRFTVNPENNKRARTGAGSGSDGEGAGSGAEMSDGTRKRIKLKLSSPGSKGGSPRDSRAGSPDVPAVVGSRAASPDAPSSTTLIGTTPFPTIAELKAHIPPEGTTIAKLLKSFKGAIDSAEKKAQFTRMLQTVSRYEKESKLLKRLD